MTRGARNISHEKAQKAQKEEIDQRISSMSLLRLFVADSICSDPLYLCLPVADHCAC
jgi:hypothetical protein